MLQLSCELFGFLKSPMGFHVLTSTDTKILEGFFLSISPNAYVSVYLYRLDTFKYYAIKEAYILKQFTKLYVLSYNLTENVNERPNLKGHCKFECVL